MPAYAITQLVNKVSPWKLPELDLVDEKQHEDSSSFKLGVSGGVLLDTIILSKIIDSKFVEFSKLHPGAAPYLKSAVKGLTISALTPVGAGADFWQEKGVNTALRLASGQVGVGLNKYTSGFGLFGDAATRTFGQELLLRGTTGLQKGAFTTQLNSITSGKGLATPAETIIGAGKAGANEVLGGAAGHLIENITGGDTPGLPAPAPELVPQLSS